MEYAIARDYFLKENLEALTKILDQVEEGILWIDFAGKIIRANRVATLKTGYSRQELTSMKIFDFLSSGLDQYDWLASIKKMIGGQKVNLKLTISTKSGNVLPLSARLQLIEIGDRSYVCALAKDTRNISEEAENIQRVVYEYDKLMYRLSHDLRSPICTILGLVNLVKMGEGSKEEQQEYLELIEQTLHKQRQLMTDVYNLSAIHTTPLQHHEINLSELMNDIVGNIYHKSEKPNTEWSFRFELEHPFFNDQYLVSKLLRPVIENAVQYSSLENRSAKVSISVSTDAEGASIDVEDNGIGIDPVIQDRIFEIFFRGSSHSNGAGLGLYLTKVVAERLNASVQLGTFVTGTRFKIFIPNAL